MASELRVNTLKDAAGNNSIATSFVAGGSAKAWVKFDGSITTPVAQDSLNSASITDSATGSYINNVTSALSNANYMMTTAGEHDGGSFASVGEYNHDSPNTTTASKIQYHNVANSAAVDVGNAGQVIHGDLA
jgi:hypothetical protein